MQHPPLTQVALVDDHNLVRQGLVGLVDRLGGYRVALQAENGLDLTRQLGTHPAIDLAIVDLNMPVMNGFATIAWLHKHHPRIKPIALTHNDTEEAMIQALHLGARGFLLKDVAYEDFKRALDAVRDHGYHESERILDQAREAQEVGNAAYERQRTKVLARIGERELAFIELACAPEEYTYGQIADRMGVKLSTTEVYRKNLFENFGIKSKAGLVIFAYRWGIVKVVRK